MCNAYGELGSGGKRVLDGSDLGFLPEEGASERQMKLQPWDCGNWLLMLMAQRAGFVGEILGDRRCVKTSRNEQ